MGLFSTTKKVYVASTVYNLNGDQDGTYQFLKSTVARAALSPDSHRTTLGSVITRAHLEGPGFRQERFLSWSRTHYGIGLPTCKIDIEYNVDSSVVEAHVPNPGGDVVSLRSSYITRADFTLWVEKHILETAPALYDTDWVADFNGTTLNALITYEDTSTETLYIPDFQEGADYLVAYYYLLTPVTLVPNGDLRLYLYRIGSGNAVLDALQTGTTPDEEFYPVIPVRLNNAFITAAPYATAIYPQAAKAYKRVFGGTIDGLIESLSDNPDLGDIDFAYVMFGLPINTPDPAGKAYIYQYLKNLIPFQYTTETEYQTWKTNKDFYEAGNITWFNWSTAQSDPGNPLYGTPEPPLVSIQPPTVTHVRLDTASVYNQTSALTASPLVLDMYWVTIAESVFSGLGKPGAKVGEIWFVIDPPEIYSEVYDRTTGTLAYFGSNQINMIRVFRQVDADTYTVLRVRGLMHRNFIYSGKSVDHRADFALGDTDPSGFIIPMHSPTLKQLSMVDRTQVSFINAQLILNSYEVVRTRWYQKGWFKVLLIVVVIAISISTGGIGAAGVGILGTNATVGAMLGFSGLAATIAGAAANMIASAVLTQLISIGAKKVLGDELGTIVGFAVAILTIQGMQAYASTGSFSINWGELMKADNLMKLTMSGTNSYGNHMQAEAAASYEEISELAKTYERQSEEIATLSKEIGMTSASFDPMVFIDTAEYVGESSETFLSRTLMTGTDIAELSLGMIGSFVEDSLELPGAIR